jgi:class 3 adenylate cyclase
VRYVSHLFNLRICDIMFAKPDFFVCLILQKGTSNLSLRIGLNSGPTTAGVLRGEKARFQLFGDVCIC